MFSIVVVVIIIIIIIDCVPLWPKIISSARLRSATAALLGRPLCIVSGRARCVADAPTLLSFSTHFVRLCEQLTQRDGETATSGELPESGKPASEPAFYLLEAAREADANKFKERAAGAHRHTDTHTHTGELSSSERAATSQAPI